MNSQHQITAFIDAKCPICRREVAMIRWLDRRNRVHFVDISAADFTPPTSQHDYETLMDEIHALTAAGDWVIGVEVFRRLYAAVGFSLLVWPTRLPGVSHLMDWGYGIFARNRVKWFSRCDDSCGVRSEPTPVNPTNGSA